MKIKHTVCGLLSAAVLLASCSSTTIIQSTPSKANVFIDGALVGTTPYQHTDSKIVGSSMVIKIEKEGYKPLVTTITRDEQVDVGAVIGGVFLTVPFLWTMKYNPTHNYQLLPVVPAEEVKASTVALPQKSKADQLRELKALVDDKVITTEEFEKEKAKILGEN